MTLQKLEVQIKDLINQAKQFQIKAIQFQRQGALVVRQGEVTARETANKFFDDGLTLLGKSIIEGRKIKEAFAAETHRKAANIKREEASFKTVKPEVSAVSRKSETNFIKATKSIKSPKHFSDKVSSIKKMKAQIKKHDRPFPAQTRGR